MTDLQASDTQALLRKAAAVAHLTQRLATPRDNAALAAFIDHYRTWIIAARDMGDAPQQWAEWSRLSLLSMLGAATLGEALAILVRFAPTLWRDRLHLALQEEGDQVALVISEPVRGGPAGLLTEIWPMATILAQLEFLVGGDLSGGLADVRNRAEVSEASMALFFRVKLRYEAGRTALVLPQAQLARTVTGRAGDVPRLFEHFMDATLGLRRAPSPMRSAIFDLVWKDRLRDVPGGTDLPGVARQLGMSPATIRRRLLTEGTTYRQVRDSALDALAKSWLGAPDRSVEQIAARLGYSDSYAFRRAFKRRNGISPRAFRPDMS